jgi:hypothetical protein
MKTTCTYLVCALAVQFFSTGISNAQTTELKMAPTGVSIDGVFKEWGDNMAYINDKTKISYTITNDKDNLYLAIKTNDPAQQSRILGAGVSFSVDPKGRKKSTFLVSYPAAGQDDVAGYLNLSPAQAQVKVQLAKYKKIHTEGFKDISEADFSAAGSNGIMAAIGYDEKGYLVFEEVIPLSLFHAADLAAKEWGYGIRLNALQKEEIRKDSGSSAFEGSGGGRGSVPGGKLDKSLTSAGSQKIDPESSTLVTTLLPELEFWGKFTLAKAQ